MAFDWKNAGIVTNPKTFEPVKELGSGIANTTSDQQLVGDDHDKPLESFEQCKHMDYNYTSPDHPIVKHKCKYQDIYGRCTRDECVFDANETSKICEKHWDECVLCGNTITLPPHMLSIPFCDLCLARLRFAESLPFTCLLCGKSQNRPSKAPFSQICDDCFTNNIFNPNCIHWKQAGSSPAEGYDRL